MASQLYTLSTPYNLLLFSIGDIDHNQSKCICVCVRVNPMSVCVCVCLVGWRPSMLLPRPVLLINIKLRLEPKCQLAHIVGDSGLVGILVVVVVTAAGGRAAAVKTPAAGVGATAQISTVD